MFFLASAMPRHGIGFSGETELEDPITDGITDLNGPFLQF